MKRPQSVRTYRPRVPRDDARIMIDAAACRAMLARRHLSPTERLLLTVAVRHGDGAPRPGFNGPMPDPRQKITFAEMHASGVRGPPDAVEALQPIRL